MTVLRFSIASCGGLRCPAVFRPTRLGVRSQQLFWYRLQSTDINCHIFILHVTCSFYSSRSYFHTTFYTSPCARKTYIYFPCGHGAYSILRPFSKLPI